METSPNNTGGQDLIKRVKKQKAGTAKPVEAGTAKPVEAGTAKPVEAGTAKPVQGVAKTLKGDAKLVQGVAKTLKGDAKLMTSNAKPVVTDTKPVQADAKLHGPTAVRNLQQERRAAKLKNARRRLFGPTKRGIAPDEEERVERRFGTGVVAARRRLFVDVEKPKAIQAVAHSRQIQTHRILLVEKTTSLCDLTSLPNETKQFTRRRTQSCSLPDGNVMPKLDISKTFKGMSKKYLKGKVNRSCSNIFVIQHALDTLNFKKWGVNDGLRILSLG